MNSSRARRMLGRVPTHVVVIVLCLVWLVPAIGLLVTSFRPFQAISDSGWWTVFSGASLPGAVTYQASCASCHGANGDKIAAVNLSDPKVIAKYPRSLQLLAMLRQPINGQPHMGGRALPSAQQAADIATYLRGLSGEAPAQRFTLSNYQDALVGYRGTATYAQDCANHTQPPDLTCTPSDLLNPRGMGRAFLNSLLVTIPATVLPILFAALAAYAFSWLHFRGRLLLFSILVGLQVVPLQMTLVPISRLYAQIGLNATFPGIWLFHTGFGLPYAIFLTFNFMAALPRDLFESAYLDGASHWTAFYRLAIPLSVPALAS